MVKHLFAMQETWVRSLGWEDPLRRKWQPIPVFLPWKSHGPRSLVGYCPWGRKELDTTERLHFHSILYIAYKLILRFMCYLSLLLTPILLIIYNCSVYSSYCITLGNTCCDCLTFSALRMINKFRNCQPDLSIIEFLINCLPNDFSW